MSEKHAPSISHLSTKDLLVVMKEANAGEVTRNQKFVATFLDKADAIGKMDRANVDKIEALMGAVARGNGGCGVLSGGCC